MRIEAIGIKETIKHLENYKRNLESKKHDLIERLAEIGIDTASVRYYNAEYDGINDVSVGSVIWQSDDTAFIVASGTKILFIEFGTGLPGYGHPQAGEFGYGPGTWSDNEALGGKGHWNDPKGWYYGHGEKSHGNPPARAMYEAGQKIREEIGEIAKEVFHD